MVGSRVNGSEGPGTITWMTATMAHITVAWGIAHAALSAYWTVGGTVGLELFSDALVQAAQEGDATFRLVAGGSAALALIAVMLAAAVAFGRLSARLAVTAVAPLGVLLLVYGSAAIVHVAFVEAGVLENPSAGDGIRWWLLLWQPLFFLGGGLLVALAWLASPQPEAPLDTGSINRRLDDIARRGE